MTAKVILKKDWDDSYYDPIKRVGITKEYDWNSRPAIQGIRLKTTDYRLLEHAVLYRA